MYKLNVKPNANKKSRMDKTRKKIGNHFGPAHFLIDVVYTSKVRAGEITGRV